MWLIVLLVLLVTLLYYLIQKHYSHWSRNGVPGPKPLPIVGNFGPCFMGKISMGEIITNMYKEYDSYPFVGFYKITTPVLLVRDPEFLKNIFVKDFKHFHNNDIIVHEDLDPLLGRNPFLMKGDENWKIKKAKLSKFFTPSKMKGMYDLLASIGRRMAKFIEDESVNSTPLELREVCIRYTLDTIAECAFGVKGESFDETRSKFRELADMILSPDSLSKIKIWLSYSFPVVNKLIRIRFLSQKLTDRMFELVRGTLKHRKENNIVRNDFLDSCIHFSTEDGLFTDVDIVANSANFFADGYETSSRVLAFLLFNLAVNPDVQEKLREEINECYQKNGNKFTFESIHKMPYLDACFKENLRKDSVGHFVSKVCTEDYTYTSTNPDFKTMTVKLKAGDCVAIPLTGVQTDPKYFDDPDRFKPERFLDAKNDIIKFTYFPFGEGPRICLGQRFATAQIKIGIAHIVKDFRVTVNSKTQLPLKFDPYYIFLHAVGGLWVDFKKI